MRTHACAWPIVTRGLAVTLATSCPPPRSARASAVSVSRHNCRQPPEVRVNQVGYPAGGPKVAYAMLPREGARACSFEVITPYGVAYRGTSTDDVGSWNAGYRAVYQLSFSGVAHARAVPGQARLPRQRGLPRVHHRRRARQLYRQLVDNAVRYFTSERDGPDVDSVGPGPPARQPDRREAPTSTPTRRYDSNDNLLGTLKKIGGPVDVSGGWFDAGGGYEKFAYTASYADALMLIAARDFPGSYAMLQPEATFGLQWITKLWNPARKVLYAQVGIGNGNASNTIQGDYNFWFLPQQEDRMNVSPAGTPARPRTTSSTGRCSRRRRPASRSAPTWRAVSPPTSPSAPSCPPAVTRRRPGTC